MSIQTAPASSATESATARPQRRRGHRRSSSGASVLAYGEPMVWLAGGALALSLVMIIGLLALVLILGMSTFWPGDLLQIRLLDGTVHVGEVAETESFNLTTDAILKEAEAVQDRVLTSLLNSSGGLREVATGVRTLKAQLLDNQSQAEVRLERCRGRLQKLQTAELPELSTVEDRLAWIRQNENSEILDKLRVDEESLVGRLAGLSQEIQARDSAIEFLEQNADEPDALALYKKAPYDIQRSIIDGMLYVCRDADIVHQRRRRIRVGNYDLTNKHYEWVADWQIAEAGETLPQEYALMERLTWGRFYGAVNEFSIAHPREVTKDEASFVDILRFFDTQITLLDSDLQTAVQDALDTQRKKLAALRHKSTSDHVASFGKLPQGNIALQDALGSEFELDVATADPQFNAAAVIQKWTEPEAAWEKFQSIHDEVRRQYRKRRVLEKVDLGEVYAQQEDARLAVRQAELDHDVRLVERTNEVLEVDMQITAIKEDLNQSNRMAERTLDNFGADSDLGKAAVAIATKKRETTAAVLAELEQQRATLMSQIEETPADAQDAVLNFFKVVQDVGLASAEIQNEIDVIKRENARYQLHLTTSTGQEKALPVGEVVRAFRPNELDVGGKWAVYLSRWWEYLTDEPRNANSEGGVYAAIFGTVAMTLIMSLAVVPFGVLAALFLREYATSGPIVSAVRIAINNLAGVPSIVFGVFGMGFFCYMIGSYIDGGPKNAEFSMLPPARWYMLLAVLALVSVAAFLGSIFSAGGSGNRSFARSVLQWASSALWIVSLLVLLAVFATSPFFGGFYEASLPNPTWGKGGIVWAALTLALMTLPVVIVATEEALAAVPNSMREGSYGCGASKWQTIRRIVLPHAFPGIMTGTILAMARGAGEVAPLMLTGAVKMARELPMDMSFPYLHGERSFMHLGYHIFDLGFHSQDSNSAKPMVYTTTFLLILIIALLNVVAVWLRALLRRRFIGGHF